jgi:hypothetical protein
VISRIGLRRSLKDWFESLEPNLYVTHNFGFRVAPESRDKSLKLFYNRMQSRVHGRNWNRRETDHPTVAVGVWEHLDSNPHCHLLIAASDDERSWLLEQGNKGWLWLQPRGQFEIGEIEFLPRVISYITKELHTQDSQDRLFIYKAPPSEVADLEFGARSQRWNTYGTSRRNSS